MQFTATKSALSLLNIYSRWRLLRTLVVRIRRRTLNRRVPLHNRAERRFARSGRDARLGHRPLCAVLQPLHRCAARRRASSAAAAAGAGHRAGRFAVVLGARLLHLDVVVELLERNLAGDFVNDEDALFRVGALVALEDGLRLAGGV